MRGANTSNSNLANDVQEMLGHVRTEKNKNEILLKCLKSVIKQSKFFAQEFKSVWSDLFENWYSWKQ